MNGAKPLGASRARYRQDEPLSTARGVLNGVVFGALCWAALLGFAALIYWNVHL